MNALLSFGYAMLAKECTVAVWPRGWTRGGGFTISRAMVDRRWRWTSWNRFGRLWSIRRSFRQSTPGWCSDPASIPAPAAASSSPMAARPSSVPTMPASTSSSPTRFSTTAALARSDPPAGEIALTLVPRQDSGVHIGRYKVIYIMLIIGAISGIQDFLFGVRRIRRQAGGVAPIPLVSPADHRRMPGSKVLVGV